MAVAKVCLEIIVRTTKADATTILAPVRKMPVELATSSMGLGECLQGFLDNIIKTDRLRPTQNYFIAKLKSKARLQWVEAWVGEKGRERQYSSLSFGCERKRSGS